MTNILNKIKSLWTSLVEKAKALISPKKKVIIKKKRNSKKKVK